MQEDSGQRQRDCQRNIDFLLQKCSPPGERCSTISQKLRQRNDLLIEDPGGRGLKGKDSTLSQRTMTVFAMKISASLLWKFFPFAINASRPRV